MAKIFTRGNVNINTAESFNALLKRFETSVFHDMRPKRPGSNLSKLSFQWSNREQKDIVTKMRNKRTIWNTKPIVNQPTSLLPYPYGGMLSRHKTAAERQIAFKSF
jgi:hypothetical protein